ncbi:MAG: hypothetical protein ACYCZF_06000 [Anaerolineae bacterium]
MNPLPDESESAIYHESILSKNTALLFWALSALFIFLFIWRAVTAGLGALAFVFLVFSFMFMFYSVNYRTLIIHLTTKSLTLRFGIFTWRVPLAHVESCQLDEIPAFMRYGGAGLHFMSFRSRYRVSFNFLEYPRLVIALKHKMGPVQDVPFTTRQSDVLLQLISQATVSHNSNIGNSRVA